MLLYFCVILQVYSFITLEVHSLDYGQKCDILNDHCDRSLYLQCSAKYFTCECQDYANSFFDSVSRCRKLVNASCSSVGQMCVKGAYCSTEEPFDTKCTCMLPAKENNHRQCFLEHMDRCNLTSPDIQCNPYAHLECVLQRHGQSLCRCKGGPNHSWYNKLNKTCHITVNGAQCGLTPHDMPCVPHSHCDDSSRKCKCTQDTTSTSTGLCFLEHDEHCDAFADLCNSFSYLHCDPNRSACSCFPLGGSIYDPSIKTCRLLSNASCHPDPGSQFCIKNSECIPSPGYEPYSCTCIKDLTANKNNKCFLDFGKPCDRFQSLCDHEGNLHCAMNNTCACENTNAVYDHQTKQCRLSLNLPCSAGNGTKCGLNQFCNSGWCKCIEGYEEGDDGNCYRSWGQACSERDNCNDANSLICSREICVCKANHWNSTQGDRYSVTCYPGYGSVCDPTHNCYKENRLNCIDGYCGCQSPKGMFYNESLHKCQSFVKQPCDIFDLNSCIQNSECYSPGICECEPGFQPTFGGICSKGFKLSISFHLASLSIFYFIIY